jgi:hypothetical protein
VLYVAKQFQYLIHSEPIANSYKMRQKSIHGNPEWVNEFAVRRAWSPFFILERSIDSTEDDHNNSGTERSIGVLYYLSMLRLISGLHAEGKLGSTSIVII